MIHNAATESALRRRPNVPSERGAQHPLMAPEGDLLRGVRPTETRVAVTRGHSYQNLAQHFTVHIGQAEVAALELVGQPGVVDAQAVQHRGVQVVDVDRVANDVVAVVVGLAVSDARLDPAAGQPDVKQRGWWSRP